MFDGSQTKLYNTLMGNPGLGGTGGYNAIGRTAGASGGGDNFFVKRGKSIENALGTTLSAGYGLAKDIGENYETRMMLGRQKGSLDDIYRQYGFKNKSDYDNQLQAAIDSGNTAEKERLYNLPGLKDKILAQANANAAEATSKANNYSDYRNNSYISNKINQDRGKFAGSAINTLSTALDVTGLTANPLANTIQGGVEGVADELEQNGLQKFDWNRAGQNALIGATTGAVTGALNKGLGKLVDPKTGNLFKGNNLVTKTLNDLGSKTAIGRVGSTIATGAARGAVSGAVGGATGAGLSAAMNGGDVIGSALQGAGQGLGQGALTGGIMSGVNMGLSKTPFMQQINQAKQNWDQSGRNFNERLTNTLNSGDSAVGNWLNRDSSSKLLNSIGNVGDSIRDYTDKGLGPLKAEQEAYKDLIKAYHEEGGIEGAVENARGAGYPNDSNFQKALRTVEGGDYGISIDDAFNDLKSIYGDDFNPDIYLNKDGSYKYKNGEPYVWTIYKNRIAMNLAKVMDQMDAGTYVPGSEKEGYVPGLADNYETAIQARTADDFIKSAMSKGATLQEAYSQWQDYNASKQYGKTTGENPTTVGEWAKRAGERIVEDANNRGVGMSVKDVSQDMPEDIRNMQVRDYNADLDSMTPAQDAYAQGRGSFSDALKEFIELGGDVVRDYDGTLRLVSPDKSGGARRFVDKWYSDAESKAYMNPVQNTNVDAWDRLAQQNGYRSYDDVIQSYMEANPNAEINPNGMAGAITTWMDENPGDWNPNQPQTAGQWAKRAGERLVEDINDRGVGMSVRDEAQNPQTELYDQLTGNKTSTKGELKRVAGLRLQKQYGTIDKPTAKATNAPETLQKIAEAGFTKPGDVERMAGVITGSNGEVSKLVSNLVATADPINTFDGETSGQTLSDYVDLSIQKNGLDGIREGNAVKSQIDAIMKSLPSHADGSVTFVDNPQDVFKLTQLLDSEAANYEGRSGMNYGTTTPDKLRAAKVIKDVSSLLKNRIYDSVDVEAALTPEVAENLKAYAPNNQSWADYIDNEVMTAKNVKDLRSVQAPWVRANKIIDNGYMNSMTYGGRNGGAGNFPLTPSGIKAAVLNATINSKPGLRLQAKVLNKVADWAPDTPKNTTTSASTGDVAVATPIAGTGYNPATQIYNAIGRTEGANAAQQTRAESYLNNAAQANSALSGYAEPLGATTSTAGAGTLESLVPTTTTGSTNSLYNALGGTQGAQTATSKYFQPTGDYWTDIIATAMSSAIDNDDVAAFSTLYNMYQNSLANLQEQSAGTTSNQKLTATQQRANAAMNSLNRIEGMSPDLAYNLSNIPVVGNIATFGGNDYEAEARSLAQQIGYMVSGSNIKETEAENIGKSYVPQPWDNEQVRRNKLARARQIIQQYQNGYVTE